MHQLLWGMQDHCGEAGRRPAERRGRLHCRQRAILPGRRGQDLATLTPFDNLVNASTASQAGLDAMIRETKIPRGKNGSILISNAYAQTKRTRR